MRRIPLVFFVTKLYILILAKLIFYHKNNIPNDRRDMETWWQQ